MVRKRIRDCRDCNRHIGGKDVGCDFDGLCYFAKLDPIKELTIKPLRFKKNVTFDKFREKILKEISQSLCLPAKIVKGDK